MTIGHSLIANMTIRFTLNFLMKKSTSTLLTLLGLFLVSSTGAQEIDIYGGNRAIKAEATGYFRIERINGRHIFITPEGHGFVPIGVNHFGKSHRTDYDRIVKELKSWGFTAGGYAEPRWMWSRIPYAQAIHLLDTKSFFTKQQFAFEDVFAPKFQSKLEASIHEKVSPYVENRRLICYFLTDIPVWSAEKFGTSWLKFYRSLPANSPGGRAWGRWKRDNPDADDQEFLGIIANRLYEHAIGFIRKCDPNHLIFTDRYAEADMPEVVVRAALKYADGVAIQPLPTYNAAFFDSLIKYDKAVYVADHVSSFPTGEHRNTLRPVAKNEDSYLEFYEGYIERLFSSPYIVGYHKCMYMDYVDAQKGNRLKQGIVRQDSTPQGYVPELKPIYDKARNKVYGRVTGTPPVNADEPSRNN